MTNLPVYGGVCAVLGLDEVSPLLVGFRVFFRVSHHLLDVGLKVTTVIKNKPKIVNICDFLAAEPRPALSHREGDKPGSS